MVRRMKTAGILLASAMLATISLTTSCTDYDNGFDEATIRYNQNFKEIFGKIDPNQDWNLVRQLAEKNGGGMNTRVNVPNINQWADPKYYNLAVPGYPDALGSYHTGSTGNIKYYTAEQWAEMVSNKETTLPNPIGDVTEEEIDYVSRWFRTHYEPGTIKISWQDYFIQDISADYDREITKTKKDEDGNEIPVEAEGKRITSVPIYDMNGTPYTYSSSKILPYSQWKETNDSRGITYGMEKLIIEIKETEDPEKKVWNPNKLFGDDDEYWENWEHIYNFNSGVATNNYGDKDDLSDIKMESLTDRTIQFYRASGTADFSYHNSDVNKRFHKYALQHLVFDIPQTAEKCRIHDRKCTNHHYDGYYLGFDYEIFLTGSGDLTDKDNKGSLETDPYGKICYKPRDGFYSNWIVKISKGVDVEGNSPSSYPKQTIIKEGLLVCEDLGETDYDFNDVVLKLQHIQVQSSRTTPKVDKFRITAMAAGGALPSTVYIVDASGHDIQMTPDEEVQKDEQQSEIHKLLNGEAPTIINAAPEFRGEGKSWTRTLEELGYGDNTEAKKDFVSYVFDNRKIKIKVEDKDERIIQPIKSKYNDTPGGTFHGTPNVSQESDAPQMMLLPINFLWPQETVFIGEAYGLFGKWVENTAETDWYTSYEKGLITLRSVVSIATKPDLTFTSACNLSTKYGWSRDSENSSDTYFEIKVEQGKEFQITLWLEDTQYNGEKKYGFVIDDIDDADEESTIITVEGPTDNEEGKLYTIKATKVGETTLTLTLDGYAYITIAINVVGKGEADEEESDLEGYTLLKDIGQNAHNCEIQWSIGGDDRGLKSEDYPNGASLKIFYEKDPANPFEMEICDGHGNRMATGTVSTRMVDVDLMQQDPIKTWQDTGKLQIKDENKENIRVVQVYIKPISSSAKKRTIRRK